jgi:hypothetical protein
MVMEYLGKDNRRRKDVVFFSKFCDDSVHPVVNVRFTESGICVYNRGHLRILAQELTLTIIWP